MFVHGDCLNLFFLKVSLITTGQSTDDLAWMLGIPQLTKPLFLVFITIKTLCKLQFNILHFFNIFPNDKLTNRNIKKHFAEIIKFETPLTGIFVVQGFPFAMKIII